MIEKKYLSTAEVAKMLGLSRVAIFKKIKKGEIPAHKIGRNFVIDQSVIIDLVGRKGAVNEVSIRLAIKKTVHDYGETLKLLGNE
ncbi:helix-turn-helix domain-containing protein [Candidatus Falkowbacteria bacterium]|nr:helix-turn-helix domain-containing protein [Candidatus Falkowbacteria bacterium]